MLIYTKAKKSFQSKVTTTITDLAFWFFLLSFLSSCVLFFGRKIDIRASNNTTDEEWIIDDLTVFFGPDKDHSGELRNGQMEKLYFNDNLSYPEPLVVIYSVRETNYSWENLTILPDNKYIVQINIIKDIIEYRSCIRPCDINAIKFVREKTMAYTNRPQPNTK